MKTRRVTRYLCDHCGHGHWTSMHARKHELTCLRNPIRHCPMCNACHVVANDFALWNDETETTGAAWVKLVLLSHQGCAKCTLAAILQMGRRGRFARYAVGEECTNDWGFDYSKAASEFVYAPGGFVDKSPF